MPTELEELVGFIAHPNPQIRAVATESLVPYSISDPAIFKTEELKPVKHLKFLINDERIIAGHALNILVNLSGDPVVLEALATDNKFVDRVFEYIVYPEEPNANMLAMLLANLSKWDGAKDLLDKKQEPPKELGSDERVLNQLMDLFVKGQDGAYNKKADFDYLAYVFADLAKHDDIRRYFLTEQAYDGVIPITKLKVFTEHKSDVRRKGVASTIKNAAFEVSSHPTFLSDEEINILPYILLPIMGNEEYDVDESLDMLPDLQLLPPDKKRDSDPTIIQTHVETLMLLTTTREGRELMRQVKVYPIVRETHLRVNDEAVQEVCERLVQVLARDEASEERVTEIEADDDDQLVEV
ncbi:Protein HGH1-like protein [Cladobotryum mycophilum]|uniref:Protein HGH1 homolog n=1 Tax=Cladobotryum mycophilum TaxID=491253 RepID=A0ABR0S706_9HYPO